GRRRGTLRLPHPAGGELGCGQLDRGPVALHPRPDGQAAARLLQLDRRQPSPEAGALPHLRGRGGRPRTPRGGAPRRTRPGAAPGGPRGLMTPHRGWLVGAVAAAVTSASRLTVVLRPRRLGPRSSPGPPSRACF